MKAYQIISDSSCDLPEETTRELGIKVVPFYVSFDGAVYKKEGEEIAVRRFYQQMVDQPNVFPKSSLPSVQDYVDAFLPYVKEEIDIFCICITTKFSGSAQSAQNAREIVLEDYPEARITVLDAQVNTVLQGLLVLEAVKLQQEGVSYEDCIHRIRNIRESGRIFFTVGSIDYLKHGGRIGKLAGTAASVLGIKPLITLKEGESFSSGIARGRKKSLEKVIALLRAYVEERHADTKGYRFCIGYGYDREEAEAFRKTAATALADLGIIEEDLPLYQIGATIGVHTGPYPLGFGVIKRA